MTQSKWYHERDYKFSRDREGTTLEMAINEATTINDFINNNRLSIDYYKINNGTIQTIRTLGSELLEYETRGLFNAYHGVIGTGYYWKLRLSKDDDRIGRRKVYKSSKGLYFIENGYREYLKDYIKLGGIK